MNANQYYISSGRLNAQYTLRCRFEDYGFDGALKLRDVYVCNLGNNIGRAKAKAAVHAGQPVDFNPFILNPYGHATESKPAAQKEYAEKQAALGQNAAELSEIIRQRREENARSQWQGSLGERITRKLTCLRWHALGQGAYGMRYVAVFRDDDFNKYVFFGGSVSSLPSVGEVATVNFTVHQHTEHEDCKQTVIKRPKTARGEG